MWATERTLAGLQPLLLEGPPEKRLNAFAPIQTLRKRRFMLLTVTDLERGT
jgi:hypothetical protein